MRAACREARLAWRERKLDPVTTVRSFLMQILYGNVACNQVPPPAEQDVTGAGHCAARSRLTVAALQALLTGATTAMTECVRETGRWLGHRLFVVDGSTFPMPDTEQLREHFGQSGQQAAGCGFPPAHFPALLHLGSGLLQKFALGPLRTHDLAQVPEVHPESEPGDVLLGDRAFRSFAHFAVLSARGVGAVFRMHRKTIANLAPGRSPVHPSRGKGGGSRACRGRDGCGGWATAISWSNGSSRPCVGRGCRRRPSPRCPSRFACANCGTTSRGPAFACVR